MTADWNRLETIFLEALEHEPPERSAWLTRACGDDPELLDEIVAMIAAHEGEGLEVEGRLLSAPEEHSLAGRTIGPYRLVSLLGRGGMGEVYLAERDDELYERRVAIKLVQAGPRPSLRERFARERAILARLVHPHIATLYDGGVAEDGRHYLVMEYVDGVSVTEHCDSHRLDLRARLDLFLKICEAVQFAHGALVIHRDLKPSNILVDAKGTVKLLDFGIAKLLEDDETEASPTVALDRVLTPEHAAPEQIRGETPTTATDVYGLGVLLCELLVGAKPLRFPTRSPVEIDRIAREVEARPPSRLLDAMEPDERVRAATSRSTTSESLARHLRGDLDAICAKALRKESHLRYGSVAELGSDLRRHLERRPVAAVRGSRAYFARKFLRRHRTSLALSALAFVVLAGFLVLSLVQARRVGMERDRAQREFERADMVLDRLVDLFESTRPQMLEGPDMLDVRDFLDRGEETAALLADEPEAQGRMYEILAEIYGSRGNLDRALDLTAQARDRSEDRLDRLRLSHLYARLVHRRDGPAAAIPLLRESLRRHRELLGEVHPDVALAMQDLGSALTDAEESRRLFERALEIQSSAVAGDDIARAAGLNALAQLEIGLTRYDEALALLEEADALLAERFPESSPRRMGVRHNLSAVYTRMGRWDLAEPLQRQIVESRRRMGQQSDLTAGALESHAVTLAHMGRHRESADAFAQALELFESTLDSGHWRIANGARNVGQLLALQTRYDEALPYLDRAIAIGLGSGPSARGQVYLEGQRAMIWLGQGQLDRARTAVAEVAERLEAEVDEPGASYCADSQVWLGIAEMHAGQPGRAQQAFRRALDHRKQLLGQDHPKTLEALCGLAAASPGGTLPEAREAARGYRAWGLAHPLLLELVDEHLR